MQIEKFLQSGELTQSAKNYSSAGTILDVGERLQAQDIFFDDISLLRPDMVIIRERMAELLSGNYSFRKLSETAALIAISGVLNDRSPVHVRDLCGGVGLLSLSISALRGGKPTVTECIDKNKDLFAKHNSIAVGLGLSAGTSQFSARNILSSDMSNSEEGHVYNLSKHPCGSNVDHIIRGVSVLDEELLPHSTTILTCCHAKSQKKPPRLRNSRHQISIDEWNLIRRASDWVNNPDPEKALIGRIAMRIFDCVRVMNLPENLQGSVHEILDSRLSPKNQAICITAA